MRYETRFKRVQSNLNFVRCEWAYGMMAFEISYYQGQRTRIKISDSGIDFGVNSQHASGKLKNIERSEVTGHLASKSISH